MAWREMEFGIRITGDGKVLVTEAGRAEKAIGNIGKTAQKVERNTSALTASFARMGHAAAAAFSVQKLTQASDAWSNMNSRILLSAASLTDASAAMEGVYRIAQKTGGDLGGLADIYQKIARNAVQYGLDQQAALGVTEALANAIRLSGGSAASASAAMMQFGQALSSGTLRGEELNSVMEQAPALAEAIARGMGKTTGELRKLGEDGALAAGEVLAAIRKESARLESEVTSMTPTIEAAVGRLKNAFTKEIGEGAGGAARLAASGIDALAANLDKATQAALLLGGAFAAMKIPALLAMLGRINPATVAIGAGLVGLNVAFNDWQAGASVATANVAKDIDALASSVARTNAQIATMSRAAAEAAIADSKRARAVDAAELDKLKARYEKDYGGDQRQSGNAIAQRDALRVQIMQAENALQRLDGEIAGLQKRAAEYTTAVAKIRAAAEDKKKVDKGIEDAATEQAKSYAQQAEAAIKLANATAIEAEAGRKLLPVEQVLALAKKTLTESQAAEIEKILAGAAAIEQKSAAEKAAAEVAKIHGDYIKANLDPLDKQIAAIEREIESYGKTEGAIQRTLAARLEEARELAAQNGAWPEHLAYLDAEIEKRKRLAAGADQKDALDAAKKVADEEQKYWEHIHEQLGQSLTDELMRGGQNAGELLQNYFKTLVLRPIIQGVVNAGLNAIGLGPQSGIGGSGSLLGTAGNLLTGGVNGGLYGQFLTTGFAQNIGLSTVAASAPEAFLAGAPNMVVTPTDFGTALPYIGAALAIASMLSSDGGGPKTEGGLVATIGGGFDEYASTGQKFYTGDGADAQVQQILEPLSTGIADLARRLGGSAAGIQIGLGYSTDPAGTAGDSVGGGVYVNGDQAYFHADGGYARGTYGQELSSEAQRVMLAALQSVDLVDWADDLLAGIDPLTASTDELAAALSDLTTMSTLVPLFEQLGFSANDLSIDLVNMMGGLDASAAALQSYSAGYFSEQERIDILTAQLTEQFDALGEEMPTTRAELRQMIDAYKTQGEEGAATAAKLIVLSDALGQVADANAAAAQAAEDAARAIEEANASALADLLALQTEWQERLDVLTGARTATEIAREKQLASTADETTLALMRQVFAQEDLAAAAEAARTAQSAALDAARTDMERAVAAERAAANAAYDAQMRSVSDAYQNTVQRMTDAYDAAAASTRDSIDAIRASIGDLDRLSSAVRSTLRSMRPDDLLMQRTYAGAQRNLDTLLASRALPNADAIAPMLDALAQGNASATSESAYLLDYARTARKLDTLAGRADQQSDAEQRALDAAEAQLDLVKRQHDEQMQLLADNRDAQLGQLATQHDAVMLGLDDALTVAEQQLDVAGDMNVGIITAAEAALRYEQIAMGTYGAVLSLVQATNNVAAATAAAAAAQSAALVPAFASGGYYSGGLALVGEDGPELINFSSGGYISPAGNTFDGFNALVNELRAVKAELAALRAEQKASLASIAGSSSQTEGLLRRVMGPKRDAFNVRAAA